MAVGKKLTVFFRIVDDGWTENYFTPSGTHQSVLDLATFPGGLVEQRLKLCGLIVQVPFVRVSDLDPTRDSLEAAIGWATEGPARKIVIPTEGSDADAPWTRILFNLISTPQIKGRIFAGGLPEKFIDPSFNIFTPSDAWLKQFAKYANVLTTQGWSIKALTQGGAFSYFKIQSVSQAPSGRLRVLLVSPPGSWQNLKVTLSKAKYAVPSIPLPHGRFVGLDVAGDPLSKDLDGTQNSPGMNAATLAAYKPLSANARLYDTSLFPITQLALGQPVSHRVGRPFGLSVGRRRRT